MEKKRRAIALGVLVCIACGIVLAFQSSPPPTTRVQGRVLATGLAPKQVIIFIGDGMGFEEVKAAGMYATGTPGSLSFEAFPHQGEMTTHSANREVTDSAASATAIATGVKVNNGVISMAIPGNYTPLLTLLEYFQKQGKSTGLVTTTEITHATPAAFGAHEPTRSHQVEIAQDYLTETRPTVLFGGGGAGMSPAIAQAAGYTMVINQAQMLALDTETTTRISGQFGKGHMPYEYDGLKDLPHLSEMTQTAIDILENDPDGLFLMIEGGRIDHSGHQNDLQRNIGETIEFSKAVEVAINWAKERNDTLILVTADHETGGLKVQENNGPGKYPRVSWSTINHTSTLVPIYAWGVNSQLVTEVIDNTDIFTIATGNP